MNGNASSASRVGHALTLTLAGTSQTYDGSAAITFNVKKLTSSDMGVVPAASTANGILMRKGSNADVSWDSVLMIDGGNASTGN